MSPGELVYADVPSALHGLPSDQMPNRLGLAYWLVDPDNPLTARVTVNRLWEQIFGRGLVETSENFGTQGSYPSHPELLDWLATRFTADGWSLKSMIRAIVTSTTYRQTSAAAHKLWERDPYNRLLARGPRLRIEAEIVRDVALAVSGLLSNKVGGESVYPHQPEGVWNRPYSDERWELSSGEDRYRRALYTFMRRTAPYPSLTTFDAPSRELCTARRVQTNTPLQALTTLNDPVFFEAAQNLALRMTRVASGEVGVRAAHGFRLAVSRYPTASELEHLVSFHREERARFVQLYHWGWDHHGTSSVDDIATALPALCEQTDRASAALVKDLKQRGMLDETLIVWGGEFGRTAMNEGRNNSKFIGRDHHPRAFTVWLAGGGVQAGVTVGRTDELGCNIVEDPVEVHDLHATVLHLMGVDHEKLTYRSQGRDFRLTITDCSAKRRAWLQSKCTPAKVLTRSRKPACSKNGRVGAGSW